MKKEMRILQIMQKERCDWQEATERAKERKTLSEFF
jgi:hypothetical protein